MSAAAIDRGHKGDRTKLDPRGRSHTTPGSLQGIDPHATLAEWDDADRVSWRSV
ncbi:hypothetical protein BJ994_003531 [Arthrobacter pigmenti]|uniref:Uncharacterized protein n=1 Tax=Arthrobacter pigmenti TaxID=271432 RepID=A0A846RY21_9MICC|nr:hypothetical protein [Arthrobacter pigmenti]